MPSDKAKSPPSAAETLFADVRWGRFLLWLGAGVLLMCGVLLAFHFGEQFLIKDRRFWLAGAESISEESPNLVLEGIHYASASQIRHQFREDFGRSLYLVPISRRREQLLAIDWIEEAAVEKIWPQTVKVSVKERQPVAFVHLGPATRDGGWRYALIDHDGFILRPRVAAQFTLPVINGVRETEAIEDRRARVGRVLEMWKEVGSLRDSISEVDVSDPNNLIVAEHAEGTVVNLMLGDENYAERLTNFIANFREIHQKRPDAKTIDLRVDGVITAVSEARNGH